MTETTSTRAARTNQRPARKMTKTAADKIAAYYEVRGWSIRKIATQVGYSYGAVRNVIVKRGIPLRARGRAKTSP